jgi:hypothetical protein
MVHDPDEARANCASAETEENPRVHDMDLFATFVRMDLKDREAKCTAFQRSYDLAQNFTAALDLCLCIIRAGLSTFRLLSYELVRPALRSCSSSTDKHSILKGKFARFSCHPEKDFNDFHSPVQTWIRGDISFGRKRLAFPSWAASRNCFKELGSL